MGTTPPRSTYAADLARANGWDVLSLACSGATIPEGLLGSQVARKTAVPPQLSLAQKADRALGVIVTVGADDLHWSGILRLCAATKSCGNQAIVAYFQRQLSLLTSHYYELLKQLALLPSHPRVLINLYYDPFDPHGHCLDHVGLTPAKQRPLVALFDALNSVLANGARALSFTPVPFSFEHHGLCDPQPYVQGLQDTAPFHPNAAGELAIALADERVLVQAPRADRHRGGPGQPLPYRALSTPAADLGRSSRPEAASSGACSRRRTFRFLPVAVNGSSSTKQ